MGTINGALKNSYPLKPELKKSDSSADRTEIETGGKDGTSTSSLPNDRAMKGSILTFPFRVVGVLSRPVRETYFPDFVTGKVEYLLIADLQTNY